MPPESEDSLLNSEAPERGYMSVVTQAGTDWFKQQAHGSPWEDARRRRHQLRGCVRETLKVEDPRAPLTRVHVGVGG